MRKKVAFWIRFILCSAFIWVAWSHPLPVLALDQEQVYTVQAGDTLWDLAVRYYNDGFSWKSIASRNNVDDPTKLPIGIVLTIPRSTQSISQAPSATPLPITQQIVLPSPIPPTPTPTPKLVPIVSAPQPSGANQPPTTPTPIEKYLTVEAALLGVVDKMSLYYKDLISGSEFSIDPSRSWIPASTIKSYVALEAFSQRRRGLITFDQPVVITADAVVPTELETEDCPRLREGTTVTIRQLVECMITQSDNTAYNTLLNILDRRTINSTLRNLGMTETVVGEGLNLDNTQFQKDLQVAGRQPNTTTVKDIVTFFTLLYTKQIPDSDELLAIFKKQKINTMIPAFLPKNVEVAHKHGDWSPLEHDAGIVYKPQAPFVLAVFTNGNSPDAVAKLSRVAYYQTAAAVGEAVETPQVSIQRNMDTITWAGDASKATVLGETAAASDEKFPTVTAADLGITFSDLAVGKQQAQRIRSALVTPGSPFYGIKRFFETQQLRRAQNDVESINIYLNQAQSRMAEAKAVFARGDMTVANQLLNDAADNLKQASAKAQGGRVADAQILRMKQVSDLHFATLAQSALAVSPNKKEQFIDQVYAFYQRNKQEVAPVIKSALVANPFEQQPLIGTLKAVKGNTLTVQFSDGTTKDIDTPTTTAVRTYHSQALDVVPSLSVGSKLAIVAQADKKGNIVPVFILRDVPKELPDKHQGTVLEINPKSGTIKIQDAQGQQETIQVDPSSTLKAKDTNVSVEGIKVGSQVTVYGETKSPPGGAPGSGGGPGGTSAPQEVHANTVTVTKNSSGKQEAKESKPQKKSEQPSKEKDKKK